MAGSKTVLTVLNGQVGLNLSLMRKYTQANGNSQPPPDLGQEREVSSHFQEQHELIIST